MEAWSLARYRRPRLDVDAIIRDGDGKVITLTAGKQVYRLACDSADGAERIAGQLLQLRDPDAPLWTVVRDSDPDSSWGTLSSFLDDRSLVGETTDGAELAFSAKAKSIVERSVEAGAAVIASAPPEYRGRIRANAAAFLELDADPSSEGSRPDSGFDLDSAVENPNFFLGLLAVEFLYMRRCAPVAWCASWLLLSEIAGLESDSPDVWSDRIAADMGWFFTERDLDAHLTLVAHCIVHSASEGAARFPTPPRANLVPLAGLEFMRKAEILTRTVLATWGPNRYGAAIGTLSDIRSAMVKGCYIEQYHLTQRYVEVITPMLHKRLSDPLRTLMFNYYSEELGHEEFERATCEALGVTGAMLDRAIPLPLHLAFVDALIEISERDPIAFFAAIMVTEGMLGEQSAVSDMMVELGRTHQEFQKVSSQHGQLNQALHHTAIARLAFEHIPVVSADRQQRAFNCLLFLLELNHRLWDSVADFYGPQKSLRMHGFLSKPWRPSSEAPSTSTNSPGNN